MSKATTAATKEQLVELMQYLSQNISVPTIGIGGGFAPIGTIISYMGTTAPQDYLICDGTTYNIADYKQLSDFFAAQFGSANFFGGDGVTTFKVPDLRGEFLRGTGTNGHSGQGNGANVGEHGDATKHTFITANNDGNILLANYGRVASPLNVDHQDSQVTGRNYWSPTNNQPTEQVVQYYTSRPTNTSVLYCIKAVVAGDVYSTTERVVGTWIDGKLVYEKYIAFDSTVTISSLNWSQELNEISNANRIVESTCYRILDNNVDPYMFATVSGLLVKVLNNKLTIKNKAADEVSIDAIKVRYTKTTD